jgi:hypothetical protein
MSCARVRARVVFAPLVCASPPPFPHTHRHTPRRAGVCASCQRHPPSPTCVCCAALPLALQPHGALTATRGRPARQQSRSSSSSSSSRRSRRSRRSSRRRLPAAHQQPQAAVPSSRRRRRRRRQQQALQGVCACVGATCGARQVLRRAAGSRRLLLPLRRAWCGCDGSVPQRRRAPSHRRTSLGGARVRRRACAPLCVCAALVQTIPAVVGSGDLPYSNIGPAIGRKVCVCVCVCVCVRVQLHHARVCVVCLRQTGAAAAPWRAHVCRRPVAAAPSATRCAPRAARCPALRCTPLWCAAAATRTAPHRTAHTHALCCTAPSRSARLC